MAIIGIVLGLVILWLLVEALANLVLPLSFLFILFKSPKDESKWKW